MKTLPSRIFLGLSFTFIAACVSDGGQNSSGGTDAAAEGSAGDAGAGGDGNLVLPAVVVTISSPSMAVTTKGPVTIQVSVMGDPDSVELTKDGAPLATLKAPYQYMWDASTEMEKTYAIVARAKKGTDSFMSMPLQVTVDKSVPTIVSTVPAPAATNVFLGDEISVTFNEPVLATTVNNTTIQLKENGITIPSTVTLDATGTKAIIVPTAVPAALEKGLDAALSIFVSGVSDRAGNLSRVDSRNFTAPLWQVPGGPKAMVNIDTSKSYGGKIVFGADGNAVVSLLEAGKSVVKRWDGSKWQQLGAPLNIDPAASAGSASLAVAPNGDIAAAWLESKHVLVKRWAAGAWQVIGTNLERANSTAPKELSVVLDTNGMPTVAFTDYEEGTIATQIICKRLRAGNWEGIEGPFGSSAIYGRAQLSLALDPKGEPTVGWVEKTKDVFVKQWNGTAWAERGGTLLADPNMQGTGTSVAVDAAGNPVVASTETVPRRTYVRRWTGAAWVQYGFGAIAEGLNENHNSPSLALDPKGTPIVAFEQDINSNVKIFVRRWGGAAWTSVGGPLSVGDRYSGVPSLTLDKKGNAAVIWTESRDSISEVYVKRINHIP
jgi:Bacterial Ig-like domain